MVQMKVLTDGLDSKEVVFFKGGEFSTPLVVMTEYQLLAQMRLLGYKVQKKDEVVDQRNQEQKAEQPPVVRGRFMSLIIDPSEIMDREDEESLAEVIKDDINVFFKIKKISGRWIIGWRDRHTKVRPSACNLRFD